MPYPPRADAAFLVSTRRGGREDITDRMIQTTGMTDLPPVEQIVVSRLKEFGPLAANTMGQRVKHCGK